MSGQRLDPTRERGSVTLFLAIAVLGLLAVAGLVVDGGAKVRAAQRADRLAAEAARAAGQAVDRSAVLAGTSVRVDVRDALSAARAYLTAAGQGDAAIAGTAEVAQDGRSIRVSTSATSQTIFLGLIGVSELTVHGSASVNLIPSERGSRP